MAANTQAPQGRDIGDGTTGTGWPEPPQCQSRGQRQQQDDIPASPATAELLLWRGKVEEQKEVALLGQH